MYVPNELIFSSYRQIEIRLIEEGWYRVEWLNHDNKRWETQESQTNPTRTVVYNQSSARLDPYTDVEGPRWELQGLCENILLDTPYIGTRCAAVFREQYTGFYSPRNSQGRIVYIDTVFARETATRFLATR